MPTVHKLTVKSAGILGNFEMTNHTDGPCWRRYLEATYGLGRQRFITGAEDLPGRHRQADVTDLRPGCDDADLASNGFRFDIPDADREQRHTGLSNLADRYLEFILNMDVGINGLYHPDEHRTHRRPQKYAADQGRRNRSELGFAHLTLHS